MPALKKGAWFRGNRGWHWTTPEGKSVSLRDANGQLIRDPDARALAQKAYLAAASKWQPTLATVDGLTVDQLFRKFCDELRGRKSCTVSQTCGWLWRFSTGLSTKYRGQKQIPQGIKRDRHFGHLPAIELKPYHLDEYLQDHPHWNARTDIVAGRDIVYCSTGRTALAPVKQAFAWAKRKGYISINPIAQYTLPRSDARCLSFSPKQVEFIVENSKEDFGLAFQFLIATGMRSVCEFASCTAANVIPEYWGEHGDTQYGSPQFAIRFDPTAGEGKRTNKRIQRPRIVFVPDKWHQFVLNAMTDYPAGPIFRTQQGNPWNQGSLADRLSVILKKNPELFADQHYVIYCTRHTYARLKREQGASPYQLSLLMGNSESTVKRYYADQMGVSESVLAFV